jgi:Flp pilus assembly pilin Flp
VALLIERRRPVHPAWSENDMVLKICGRTLDDLWRGDQGQDLVEYALLVGLVALVAAGAVTEVGTTINGVFWDVIAAAIP